MGSVPSRAAVSEPASRPSSGLTVPRSYTHPMAQAPALPRGFELPLEPRLPRIGSVDAVALEERAATLAKRSIKRESKLQAFELAVRMMDLTTLEGADTPGKVAALCSKALRPDPSRPRRAAGRGRLRLPEPRPGREARLEGSSVKVASVATYFPSGQASLDVKFAEVRDVVALGADEVDMVIDRGAFLSGRYAKVYDEIVQGQGGLRGRAPEGDPRDGRARHVRQRAPRLAARDGGRRRLHQDLDRQGAACGDAARDALHARGDPRRLRGDRAASWG